MSKEDELKDPLDDGFHRALGSMLDGKIPDGPTEPKIDPEEGPPSGRPPYGDEGPPGGWGGFGSGGNGPWRGPRRPRPRRPGPMDPGHEREKDLVGAGK